MARKVIQITDIFKGHMPSSMFGEEGQFLYSLGIDPDVPITDGATDFKTGGIIRPVNYVAFNGAEITNYPIAIITTPKDEKVYVVLADGYLVSYDSSLANPIVIGQVSENEAGVAACGAAYYNNYIYITTPTDVAQYGPLDNSPTLVSEAWTDSGLGTQTALTAATYPGSYLKHFCFTHVDNKLYIFDYAAGRGMVHCIKTTKTTDEGDTNDGSAYNLPEGNNFLPLNYLPMCGSSYGNDIVIGGSFTTSATILQGGSALIFWDCTSPNFYRIVHLPDAIVSCLKYINGTLYGISGELTGGYRLWRYVGGDSVETLKMIDDGYPPMQYAIDAIGNRVVWATNTTTPVNTSGLMAYGSKSDLFPRGLHHIAMMPGTVQGGQS